jgi:hypothetical protein
MFENDSDWVISSQGSFKEVQGSTTRKSNLSQLKIW